MKVNFFNIFALVLILFISGCKENNTYDYNAIVPVVLGDIQGPTEVVQTFSATYSTSYFRGGSKWNWTVKDATIKSISEDTHSITVQFDELPADGKAKISVSETTHGGLTSDTVSLDVLVKQYCPLANGINDLVGNWIGVDGNDGSEELQSVILASIMSNKLKFTGMSVGFIESFWGETVIKSEPITVTINEDGTLEIPRQYVYTTVYDGDEYDYEIKGSGTWENCGATPSMVINYDIYYAGETDGLAATYYKYLLNSIPYLTATISLSNQSSGVKATNFKISIPKKIAQIKALEK
ncbi:hypothetical protein TRIP_D420107 [uncultured Paludibacter sp.]|nr:hypothetical protein TRIP_D420107 [uncultured Paludibacter sp.]